MNKMTFQKFLVFFILFCIYFCIFVRNKFSLGLFVLILVICIFTDLGGYIFGKILKGPKLVKISPKKTYAGAFGGFILSAVAALVYSNIQPMVLLPI